MKTVKRFNVRLMLAILAGILLVVLVVALVHGVQVRRNAQGLADLARLKVKEGKAGEAIMLYARYLQFRPSDAVAQGEYARLMLARAEGPNASRGDRAMAYDAVESAVSKNPRDRELRATLADLMLRMGRFGAAGEQLDILLGSGGPSPADGTASPPEEDRDALTLLRARAYLGTANYRESAALLAGICGFDLETGAFSSDQAAAEQAAADTGDPVVFQASVFLSALLDEKLRSPAAARAVLDHLVETHPDDFRGWLARANWHRSRDDFLAAAADLAKARALAPADAGVLFTRDRKSVV